MNYLVDIDGTLLNGSEPILGAIDFINRLNHNGSKYLLMTNSIRSKELQQMRLEKAGFKVNLDSIVNPIVAINKYLVEMIIKKVKIIGSELEINQINAVNDNKDYDAILLLDFEKSNFGYNVIQEIVDDIESGKNVITASLSTFYLKNGKKAVDTGAFVKIIEDITNVHIKNFGKPSIQYFDISGKILNEESNNIYVIGDDWNTDILGANRYGAKSILVKTGKYKDKDETKCNPYLIVNTLNEL